MIRLLQKRFVRTAMISLLLLMLILFLGIGTISYASMEYSIDDLLDQITSTENQAPPPDPEKDMPIQKTLYDRRNMAMLNYFVVYLDSSNGIESVDTASASPDLDETTIENLVNEAVALNSESGRIESYKYKMSRQQDGATLAFVDYAPFSQMLINSLGAVVTMVVFCSLLMFLILILVSKRAIQPIADTIEKQRRFVIDAGHEIGTPLAIISANAEALDMHYGKSKWSDNIQSQVVRLDGLMKQLLALSRLDEEAPVAHPQEINLSELVEENIESLTEIAAQKDLSFRKDITPSVIVSGDSAGLYQLVSVLTDNALKYADTATEITITVAKEDKSATLELSNTCSNLPDIAPEAFFDRFYRGDSARTQKSGGYGIGLSVALAVAEQHGGSINIFLDSPPQIRFRVELPRN